MTKMDMFYEGDAAGFKNSSMLPKSAPSGMNPRKRMNET
jgi:hypothetical protein